MGLLFTESSLYHSSSENHRKKYVFFLVFTPKLYLFLYQKFYFYTKNFIFIQKILFLYQNFYFHTKKFHFDFDIYVFLNRSVPSKEMQGAMKVLNDYLQKPPSKNQKNQLKNAVAIVQQEWFQISSLVNANPLDVEDYLDCFEDISYALLEHIVNMGDGSVSTFIC